jgi:LPS O-antigen subunit length determinant protein (WzzB/FepE family)
MRRTVCVGTIDGALPAASDSLQLADYPGSGELLQTVGRLRSAATTRRQVEILEKRQNEDLYLKDLAEWRQEAEQLKGIKFDTSELKLVRLDQQALEPLSTVKPKKALIIALGAVGGLMLGVFVALLRNLLRPRQTDRP